MLSLVYFHWVSLCLFRWLFISVTMNFYVILGIYHFVSVFLCVRVYVYIFCVPGYFLCLCICILCLCICVSGVSDVCIFLCLDFCAYVCVYFVLYLWIRLCLCVWFYALWLSMSEFSVVSIYICLFLRVCICVLSPFLQGKKLVCQVRPHEKKLNLSALTRILSSDLRKSKRKHRPASLWYILSWDNFQSSLLW